jgi:ubiquinone/menaquinone biosynthesis C-methylase UbiE
VTLGQRFARIATQVVVRRPMLWRLFRRPLTRQFDRLATVWDGIRSPGHLASFEAALELVPEPPRRALDLGTGTGDGALAIARRWPSTEVVGVDIAEAMVERAREKTPPELDARVRFERADAAALPYPDGAFDLVALANMIPFFDELARVVAPGGRVLFAYSLGPETPIYVPPEVLRDELAARGFGSFAELARGPGTALLGEKRRDALTSAA